MILEILLKASLCLLILSAIMTYLIIRGGSLVKSEYERKIEDEEQMRYIAKYKNEHISIRKRIIDIINKLWLRIKSKP